MQFLNRSQQFELFEHCQYEPHTAVVHYTQPGLRAAFTIPAFRQLFAGYCFPISADDLVVTYDPFVALRCLRDPLPMRAPAK